jgi:hypothetical protein
MSPPAARSAKAGVPRSVASRQPPWTVGVRRSLSDTSSYPGVVRADVRANTKAGLRCPHAGRPPYRHLRDWPRRRQPWHRERSVRGPAFRDCGHEPLQIPAVPASEADPLARIRIGGPQQARPPIGKHPARRRPRACDLRCTASPLPRKGSPARRGPARCLWRRSNRRPLGDWRAVAAAGIAENNNCDAAAQCPQLSRGGFRDARDPRARALPSCARGHPRRHLAGDQERSRHLRRDHVTKPLRRDPPESR